MSLNFSLEVFLYALCLALVPLALAQEKSFAYDDHGKRDPFSPLVASTGEIISYESDLTVSDMALQGILADAQGKNIAIVNGKVVKAGDHIGAYEVLAITAAQLQLRKDQQDFTLNLKKGGM